VDEQLSGKGGLQLSRLGEHTAAVSSEPPEG
jgi:hypothetical protein